MNNSFMGIYNPMGQVPNTYFQKELEMFRLLKIIQRENWKPLHLARIVKIRPVSNSYRQISDV